MNEIARCLDTYIRVHPFNSGDSSCETVLDQLNQAYAESHESEPAEIGDGFKELEEFLHTLRLEDNNAVVNLCCRLCSAYERKAFVDGLQYGSHLILELTNIPVRRNSEKDAFMSRNQKLINNSGIPQHIIESIAQCMV